MKRADDPLVAICMATHNPPQSLFQRQVESICSQTHERFVCLVSDDCSEHEALDRIERACEADPRFVLAAHSEKVGFYRNFERCLSHVPREAAFVALADHDDDWSHDKLEVLLGALLDSGALLAYSDMRVVDEHGGVVAPSYWTGRKNNHERFGSLLLANTVTGAASLFRRELLDDVLPFPPPVGHAFHDHWIACVALCLGEITYVDRPLYDYVQHGGNVIGHNAPPRSHRSGLLALLLRFFRNPSRRLRTTVAHARDLYVSEAVRLEVFSREL
jgi:glycosyltransferase involved in cell wall biosynthesis